jgi:hypothetical protein
MRYAVRRMVRIVAMVLLSAVVLGLLGAAVMLLWNALVPPLFRGPLLTFWQAIGLLLLSRILFGSLRAHGGWRRHRWRERWEQLSPEERARLRERFAHRCGRGDGRAATEGPTAA